MNKIKNKIIKTGSSVITTILVILLLLLTYDLLANGKSVANLIGFLFVSPMTLWAVFENAMIQSRVDLFDGSDNLPDWVDVMDEF